MTQSIHDVVVHVLAHILDRSPQDILEDKRRWAAYHWDDGFLEGLGDSIDWETGTFEGQDDVEHPFGSRGDFDGARSIVYDESVDPGVLKDGALKDLAQARHGHFYLPQFGQLVRAGHIEVDNPMIYGKIRSGDSIVDAATHLFLLHRPLIDDEDVYEFYEVDEQWSSMLSGVEDPLVRKQVGLFFQDMEASRCVGAFFEGVCTSWEDLVDLDAVATWSSGEGQGSFCIARVVRDEIPALPEFDAP